MTICARWLNPARRLECLRLARRSYPRLDLTVGKIAPYSRTIPRPNAQPGARRRAVSSVPGAPLLTILPGPLQWLLTQLSPAGRAVVLEIAECEGLFVSSTALAGLLGLRDRHALRRLLRDEGLPSYSQLAGWIRVVIWVVRYEERGVSLSEQALTMGCEPRSYYRTVRSVTGCTWREIRSRGSTWMACELEEHLVRRVASQPVSFPQAS